MALIFSPFLSRYRLLMHTCLCRHAAGRVVHLDEQEANPTSQYLSWASVFCHSEDFQGIKSQSEVQAEAESPFSKTGRGYQPAGSRKTGFP